MRKYSQPPAYWKLHKLLVLALVQNTYVWVAWSSKRFKMQDWQRCWWEGLGYAALLGRKKKGYNPMCWAQRKSRWFPDNLKNANFRSISPRKGNYMRQSHITTFRKTFLLTGLLGCKVFFYLMASTLSANTFVTNNLIFESCIIWNITCLKFVVKHQKSLLLTHFFILIAYYKALINNIILWVKLVSTPCLIYKNVSL